MADQIADLAHHDIRDIAARPREFSSARGLLLTEYRHALTATTSFVDDFFNPEARFLEFPDPPEHRLLRNLLAPWFHPKAALLRALFSRFSAISIIDEPVPVRGIPRNGWGKLWLSFTV